MSNKTSLQNRMRIYHRYLGYFLAGIMIVYAVSGITLIFRNTNFLKRPKQVNQQLKPGLSLEDLGKAICMKDIEVEPDNGTVIGFEGGNYNKPTGAVSYTVMNLAPFAEKLTRLHKASTKDPLFFLNVFFGASLLFFAISSFWMFLPKTSTFKRGMIFTAGGIVLVLIMLFIF